jgi:lipopolysaccharide/colanic/teichoic acid biosynthesis glycosyltransferase
MMFKRALDIVGSAVGLCLSLPVVAAAAIVIKLDSPGPVFFVQTRSGQHGVGFSLYKLRTMAVGTRPVEGTETEADDPRITRAGAFLRRTGLDELPQLVCVLRGDMSLVGPRPLLQWENDRCDPRQATRLRVRPGLTGLAQVCGRNRIGWAERMELDARYVETMSLRQDLWILLKTLGIVLGGRDAYRDASAAPSRAEAGTPPRPAGARSL